MTVAVSLNAKSRRSGDELRCAIGGLGRGLFDHYRLTNESGRRIAAMHADPPVGVGASAVTREFAAMPINWPKFNSLHWHDGGNTIARLNSTEGIGIRFFCIEVPCNSTRQIKTDQIMHRRKAMLKTSVALGLLATVMIGGTAVNRARAFVAAPAAGMPIVVNETIQDVRWVCGPSRCDWQPLAAPFRPIDRWATNWEPPRTPGCYRVKRRGHWREICPH